MNTSVRILSRFLVFCAVFAACAVIPASAADEPPGSPVGTLAVPSGTSNDEVRDIIINSLVGRSWQVKSKESNRVVGYLNHRLHDATITFIIKDGSIDIFCVGYKVTKEGERVRPELPDGWIGYLKKDITKRLAMKEALK